MRDPEFVPEILRQPEDASKKAITRFQLIA